MSTFAFSCFMKLEVVEDKAIKEKLSIMSFISIDWVIKL